ncbi:hypothetical protein OXB_0043 [Bacillus sp. OxB-1]|nr:hypothetical protein OXB_0043 [Bacillus sp. OxB-1]
MGFSDPSCFLPMDTEDIRIRTIRMDIIRTGIHIRHTDFTAAFIE